MYILLCFPICRSGRSPTMIYLNMTNETLKNGETEFGFVLEDYSQRVIISIILAVVFIFGIPGNTLVILAVILSHRLRSPTTWFVVNLAATDFITCAFIPLHIVALLSQEGWPLPAWICAVSAGTSFVCVTSSTTNLALIAFSRWYLLKKPHALFQTMFNQKKMFLMVTLAWVYSVVVVVVPTAAGVGALGFSNEFKTCSLYDGDGSISTTLYGVVLAIGIFVLPFIPTVTFYSLIYGIVRRHTKKMASHLMMAPIRSRGGLGNISSAGLPSTSQPATVESELGFSSTIQNDTAAASTEERPPTGQSSTSIKREHINFTKKMALILCVFFVCYLPIIVVSPVPSGITNPVVPWAQTLVLINSALNPIIYAWAIPAFREVMGCILRCRYNSIPKPVCYNWRLRS